MIRRKTKKILKVRKNSPVNKLNYIDYKDIELISKFLNHHGNIKPRRVTGASARHQRMIATAIKRARFMALIPYTNPRVKKTRIKDN